MHQAPNFAQVRFDQTYITSTEIMKQLGISRSGLLAARKAGKLPNPIYIAGQIFIWERASITEYLNAWRMVRHARGGVSA